MYLCVCMCVLVCVLYLLVITLVSKKYRWVFENFWYSVFQQAFGEFNTEF